MIAAFLIYIYMGQITRLQCEWKGFYLFPGLYGGALEALLSSGRMTVNVLAVSHFFELLCLPVIYNRWISIGLSRNWAIMLAMPGALIAGLLPALASSVAGGSVWHAFNGDFYVRLAGVMILALLLVIYIDRFESEPPENRSGVLDFIFAFFGSYGRLQETEKTLREWQNRFYALFDHSTEIIITCDSKWKIIDANIAAKELFRPVTGGTLPGKSLAKLLSKEDGSPVTELEKSDLPAHFDCILKNGSEQPTILQSSIFLVQLPGQQLKVMTARDVSCERALAREREALTDQLNHSQRLESLGILAGGIAHDFNNCIHAILGYVDVATLFNKDNPEALNGHLNKIGQIAEQAGKLTSQMLGFARRGKYHVVEIRLNELFEQCRMLMSPQKLGEIEFIIQPVSTELQVAADTFQLQQVLINMLLNAVDALQGVANARLELTAMKASELSGDFNPPPGDLENVSAGDYIAIIIRDNGCGMPPEVAERIFEPFFTTKPVGSGTGMGLSMAYGIIANHRGWIQLDSQVGSGTTFTICLPSAVKQ